MSETPLVLHIASIDESTRNLTGGKASCLSELAKAGFRVPDGFVVTTNGYEIFIRQNELEQRVRNVLAKHASDKSDVDAISGELRRLVETSSMPEELADSIRDAYREIGSPRVAVRSSATAEDLPEASFAGQYDTSLNIDGADSVIEHVQKCFGSMWTARAIAYREDNGIPHDQVRVAVVVQRMVDAKSAGVLFTRNPLNPEKREMMIESNFGLGESVVSGYGVPDRYVIDSTTLSLVSKEIGTKGTVVTPDEGSGVKMTSLTIEDGQISSLDDDEVESISEAGIAIERHFASPQDIEWAVDRAGSLHILQSRPITVGAGTEQDEQIFWTRGYSDDYWNDNVTPLFFDLLGDHLTFIVNNETNQIMGYKGMQTELMKLFRAHAYFNLDVLKTKVVNEMPPFIRSDDLMNYFPAGSGPYGRETMRALPFNLKARIMAEIRVMLLDPDGSMTKTASVYEKWTEEVFLPYCRMFDEELDTLMAEGSVGDLMRLADDLDKVMMKHFRLVRYGIPVHNLGMNLITNYLLKRWLGEKAQVVLFPILVSGLEHKTSETNRGIYSLADLIRSDRGLMEAVQVTPSDQLRDTIESRNTPAGSEFIGKLDEFLDEFGVRGFTREVYYPRWQEEPAYVFDILKSLVSDENRDLSEQGEILAKKRAKAEQIVEDALRNQRFGPIKLMLFNTILNMSRTYIAFRENQRFNLDRWITRHRRLFLRMGDLLRSSGYLENAEDIFFLHRMEIRRIVKNPAGLDKGSLSEAARKRHEEFKRHEDVIPPKFLHGDREFNDPLPDSSEALRGIPASQGVVTGTVRVLSSVNDIPQVRAGDILVVPRTDPGWTPVFSKIGGLVTETGGILSHGAVVSREFGIPAVTNIRNACRALSTGQRVTLDGNQGFVVLEDEEHS